MGGRNMRGARSRQRLSLAGLRMIPGGDTHLVDDPWATGGQGVEHLHRLDDDDRVGAVDSAGGPGGDGDSRLRQRQQRQQRLGKAAR